jgi:hypothetical protein
VRYRRAGALSCHDNAQLGPLLLAATASFLVVLGFAFQNEDLKFVGLIELGSFTLIVLTRRLVRLRRSGI